MNEIKIRAKRARFYRRRLDVIDIDAQWKWCICVGLWETVGYLPSPTYVNMNDE